MGRKVWARKNAVVEPVYYVHRYIGQFQTTPVLRNPPPSSVQGELARLPKVPRASPGVDRILPLRDDPLLANHILVANISPPRYNINLAALALLQVDFFKPA